jgi:hypothetical protein
MFKSLFSRAMRRYYLQPRIFQVNMQVRLREKYILLNETVMAHSGEQAYDRAIDNIKEMIEIKGVGHKVIGRPESLKKLSRHGNAKA